MQCRCRIGKDEAEMGLARAEATTVNHTGLCQPHRTLKRAMTQAKEASTRHGVLIIVENLPVPFDRRVWQEARALKEAGYGVAVICPKGKAQTSAYEEIDGIHIYRHSLPNEASASAAGFLIEYAGALFWQLRLSAKVFRRHGFDVIHACNPPDLIFLVALIYKILFRKKFIFDHHDIVPEMFEVKFGRRGFFYKALLFCERLTFLCANASIATNETFKRIAIERGGMPAERVWVVKSYPDLNAFRRVAPDPALRKGRAHLVGYVGIMNAQDRVDMLLLAMQYIVRQLHREDIHCLLIGDGPEYEHLVRLSEEMGLTSFITFTGYLTGAPLLVHLSSLDIGAIPDPPNPYNDKISLNKVFEYMALGIPFVQYDLAESRSQAGAAAVVAKTPTPQGLGEAIVQLIDDPQRRAEMAALGMSRAQKEFRWETETSQLLGAYAAILTPSHPRS
jgi:glycosyltransferase involved in cell wall biosynthesis